VLAYVGFGGRHAEVTREPAFRRALDRALARGGLGSIGSGERVSPTREPVPIEAGAAPLDAAGKAGDAAVAAAQLATAAHMVAALAHPAPLEILVEDTRPDDALLAERVQYALDKLGIAATIAPVTASVLHERVAKGAADLYIGQLALPVAATAAWWGAVFAAGGDDWPVATLATSSLDPITARAMFAQRLPIIPLVFRAVRLWHRTDLRGLAFDATGRPCYADMFLFGAPVPTKGRP
jgi:hypothetical protein